MTVERLRPFSSTIFAEMSALAARIGAVNLGQGFPDEDGPPAMLKAARQAIADGVNQYPPGLGIPALRQAIADQRRRRYGTEYDPDTEVLVTVGATEAIAGAMVAAKDGIVKAWNAVRGAFTAAKDWIIGTALPALKSAPSPAPPAPRWPRPAARRNRRPAGCR